MVTPELMSEPDHKELVSSGLLLQTGQMLIEISSLAVSVASLITSVWIGKGSLALARDTLKQAKEVTGRASDDWRQQQWFSLFVEGNTAVDLLDRHYAVMKSPGGPSWQAIQPSIDAATLQIKKVLGLAVVFPKCAEIDFLFAAASTFRTEPDYANVEKRSSLFDAVEDLRQRALVSSDVLGSSPSASHNS